MKLTKYEHACVVLEDQGKALIIDPGTFSSSLPELGNVVGVAITHVHGDHYDPKRIEQVKAANSAVKLWGPKQVADENPNLGIETVKAGQTVAAGPFELEFFGGNHELYESFENLAILINGKFLHPGDSYTAIEKSVPVLGLPASAPWLRVPDAIEYLKAVKPQIAIPIHNALLSEIGESIHYRILGEAAQEIGAEWRVLKPGESLDI